MPSGNAPPAVEVAGLYATLTTKQLLYLKRAFERDLACGANVAFCQGRLAALADELTARGTTRSLDPKVAPSRDCQS